MRYARLALCGILLGSLTGCGDSKDFPDLQGYMDEVRSRPRPPIEALPGFQPYAPFTYNAMLLRSPFQPPIKIDLSMHGKGSLDIKPDENRIKQFLESFNLDSLEMVGTLSNERGRYALLRGAGGVHRVKTGDYLGLNDGRIVLIDADRIDVVEIIPDGMGGWLERPRSLLLKESS